VKEDVRKEKNVSGPTIRRMNEDDAGIVEEVIIWP